MSNLSKAPIILNLPKPAGVAIQAAVTAVLSVPWAAPALAQAVPTNTEVRSQAAAPVLRVGDLVRLRSGGPALTVKSVHGNWVICTWWHQGFSQFRTAGFPVAMIEGPITLPPAEARPQTDAGLQTTGQASPLALMDSAANNSSDVTADNARTSTSPSTAPAQASSQQGAAQSNFAAQGTEQNSAVQGTNQNLIVQGTDQPIGVFRARPAPASPQGPVQRALSLPQITESRVIPALIIPQSTLQTAPQGTVQTAFPLQQSAGVNQMRPGNPLTSMSPQGAIGRRF